MAENSTVKTRKDITIKILDGTTPTPLEYTISKEVGDFSFEPGMFDVEVFRDRGDFGATPDLREGDEQPTSISFSVYFRHATDASEAILMDILNQSGYVASNWVSTLGSDAEIFTVQLEVTIEGSDHGESDQTYTFNHVFLRYSVADGYPNVVNVTGLAFDAFPTAA